MNAREMAQEIFHAGIAAAQPDRLVRAHLKHLRRAISSVRKLYVIGAGKATAPMAKEVEAQLGRRITAGHIVVKYGHALSLRRIETTEAAHPEPDANCFKGAVQVLRLAQRARQNDLVLCLVSGGASALLADCPPGISRANIALLNKLLVHSGADITEINTVRKHLSLIKGGQLARAIHPALVVSLILSDVLGDPLDVIASGPTAPDSSTFADALGVLKKYRLDAKLPAAILRQIRGGIAGRIAETPKPGDPIFNRTENRIIGNNRTVLEACKTKATALGFGAVIVNDALRGDAVAAAKAIVDIATRAPAGSCLLFGGETTVAVRGSGQGGRNQHLALAASLLLKDRTQLTLLAGGTDGTDGLTEATGAIVDSETWRVARAQNLSARQYLTNCDSYGFFRRVGGHLVTGPTFTNVMDLVIVLTSPSPGKTSKNRAGKDR